MTGLPRKVARRWYLAGTVLSVIALICAVLSQIIPHYGYPAAFAFTMFGFLAVTRPNWELPERRRGVAMATATVFLIQMAIMYTGVTAPAS